MATDNDESTKWWEKAFGPGPEPSARQDRRTDVARGCLVVLAVGFAALLLAFALLMLALSNSNF